jgi:hypothetical protein
MNRPRHPCAAILDSVAPEVRLIAAVHDTDYFAKLPGASGSSGGQQVRRWSDTTIPGRAASGRQPGR